MMSAVPRRSILLPVVFIAMFLLTGAATSPLFVRHVPVFSVSLTGHDDDGSVVYGPVVQTVTCEDDCTSAHAPYVSPTETGNYEWDWNYQGKTTRVDWWEMAGVATMVSLAVTAILALRFPARARTAAPEGNGEAP